MVEKCYKIHVTHLYEIYGHNTCEIYVQPLFKIAIHRALFAFHVNASLKVEPVLGTKVTQIVFLFMFILL